MVSDSLEASNPTHRMQFTTALGLTRSFALVIAFAAAAAPSRADTAELSLRSKVAFIPNDITIDGTPRPDIGRALVDSFSAAALKRGKYRIFNVEAPVAACPLKRKHLANAGAAEAIASQPPAPTMPKDIDFLYTFNLVGEGDRYSLTVKKVRAANNEVIEAQETSASGRLDRVFALVPTALDRIDAKLYPPAFPRTQSPAEVRAAVPVVVRDGGPAYFYEQGRLVNADARFWAGSVPTEFADVDLKTVPKALIYQRLGTICATNEPWRFAIINPHDARSLNTNDALDVQWDDGGPGVYARLKVSSKDSGKVIADFGSNPSYHRLYPGDSVYGWAPPVH